MSDSEKNEESKPALQAPLETSKGGGQNTATLPILTKPNIIIDEISGMCWVGLPLDTMDKLEACCHLDQVKIHIIAYFKKKAAMPKLVLPSMARNIANGMKRLITK